PSTTNPGENATTLLKRSPLISPSEIAYEAPSENPPMAMRARSTAASLNVASSTRFRYSTSVPKSPPMASHVVSREFGASTATPASSYAESRYQNMSSALCVAPCSMTSNG